MLGGGVHPTHLPDQTIQDPLVDICVVGEAEDRIARLVSLIAKGDHDEIARIPGVHVKGSPPVPLSDGVGYADLSRPVKLPYAVLDPNRYVRSLNIGPKRELQVWTSRGCPHRCRYCSNASLAWPNTNVRLHPVDHIVEDIKRAIDHFGADCIKFTDENFVLSERRLVNIFNALGRAGITCQFRFSGRVDKLTALSRETYAMLKQSNVVGIATAPESGSEKVLKLMGKQIRIDQVYALDDKLSRFGFHKTYLFLMGIPGETVSDLKQTIELIANLAKRSSQSPFPFGTPHIYIPLPGTELYKDAIRFGFRPPVTLREWCRFDLENMEESLSLVRPWIRGAYKEFLFRTLRTVSRLNRSMTGNEADQTVVAKHIASLEALL